MSDTNYFLHPLFFEILVDIEGFSRRGHVELGVEGLATAVVGIDGFGPATEFFTTQHDMPIHALGHFIRLEPSVVKLHGLIKLPVLFKPMPNLVDEPNKFIA